MSLTPLPSAPLCFLLSRRPPPLLSSPLRRLAAPFPLLLLLLCPAPFLSLSSHLPLLLSSPPLAHLGHIKMERLAQPRLQTHKRATVTSHSHAASFLLFLFSPSHSIDFLLLLLPLLFSSPLPIPRSSSFPSHPTSFLLLSSSSPLSLHLLPLPPLLHSESSSVPMAWVFTSDLPLSSPPLSAIRYPQSSAPLRLPPLPLACCCNSCSVTQ